MAMVYHKRLPGITLKQEIQIIRSIEQKVGPSFTPLIASALLPGNPTKAQMKQFRQAIAKVNSGGYV